MNEDKFKKIDDFNDVLSGLNTLILASLRELEQLDGIAQDKIDDYCIRISEKINAELSEKRSELVKGLKQAYLSSNEVINELEPLVESDITDLPSVINAVNKIIGFLSGPYKTAVEFLIILRPKLKILAANLNDLMDIKDKIPVVGIYNYDKLNIYIEPITISDITGNKTE